MSAEAEPELIDIPPKEVEDESFEGDSKKAMMAKNALRHDADDYPMRQISFMLMGSEVNFNPLASLVGFALLWALIIWAIAEPDKANEKLLEWQAGVTENFSWFIAVSNPAHLFYLLWLAIRYGNIKLGKKDEKPEFSDSTYFMMLLSAGMGAGMFFFGVAEPLYHRSGGAWFANTGYMSQDEVDQWALVQTLHHMVYGWCIYTVVAVGVGLGAYRFDLPITVRSMLYPILGHWTWGWIGDLIDGYSIAMTVTGVCASLGIGAMQVVAGAIRIGWTSTEDLSEDERKDKHVIATWAITAVATISVVSGLSVGIKFLSQIGFGLGMLLLLLCLIMEKTNYIFNLIVQTIGYFFQYDIFLVPFHTDAFGQLEPGEGRAVDGNSSSATWFNSWAIFYFVWFNAWAVFVGLFLARISRGRTIREVILGCVVATIAYCFLWFCTFGGIGLRQARQAEELEAVGNNTFGDPAYFRVPGNDNCYNVPQDPVVVEGETVFFSQVKGITPVCQAGSSTESWFNVMYSFSFQDGEDDDFVGFGGAMAGISLFAAAIYFVTSSDSGSLVVDHLASNGHEDHHWCQRVLWAVTEGAAATALLASGGSESLDGIAAAAVVAGLPFGLVLFLVMFCTVKMCAVAEAQDTAGIHNAKLPAPEDTSFVMPLFGGVLNIMEYIGSLGRVHEERVALGMDLPLKEQVIEFFIGLFAPFYSLFRIMTKLDYSPVSKYGLVLVYSALFFMSVVFFGLADMNRGYAAFGASCWSANACILTVVRSNVRERFSLDGNVVGDFSAGFLFYAQALCQMIFEFENNHEENDQKEITEEVEQNQMKDVQVVVDANL